MTSRLPSVRWIAAASLFLTTAAMACPVCFGDKDSDLTKGAASGVLFMVVMTYCLLMGIGGFIAFWMVRARRMRLAAPLQATDHAASDQVVDG